MLYLPLIQKTTERATLVLAFICLCGVQSFAAGDAAAVPTATSIDAPATMDVTPVQQPSPVPAPTANISPTSNQATQSQQGRQYGQPGFVGEPINLNVVNADIRDILNYITEQYGVNFVIDSSVGNN
jgi:type IV pilus assembly protein PilQ